MTFQLCTKAEQVTTQQKDNLLTFGSLVCGLQEDEYEF
jgi:hypothetical protein